MSEAEGFDALLGGGPPGGEGPHDPPAPRRAGAWWLAASLVAVLGGVAAIVAAVVLGTASPSPAPGAAVTESPADAPAADAPSPPTPASAAPATGGIAGLADGAWVRDLAARTGIPERALRAYTGASLRLAADSPGCGLGWNTLAGIGHVESAHGTIEGSRLTGSGQAEPPIIGIALDGSRSNAIADTDGGRLDGEAAWDRAVGPMQFIPSTWAVWAADGNGDGVRDPQNIDDASLTAARYLCARGRDLSQPENWIAAIASYNDAAGYNNRVADAATHYASLA